MNTSILNIDPNSFSDAALIPAARILLNGGLVAFPTETVYGLGANALDSAAVDSVFEAKGRPHDNPLIVHVLDPMDCEKYAEVQKSDLFHELAARFMPGPLTVILPKKPIIPDAVTVGLPTVALRCPSHPIARALIRVSGVPIAAPSANLSGKPSPTIARDVIEDMDGRIPMIISGGDAKVGLESTVISLKGDTIHLLRPGYVTPDDLRCVTERIVISEAVLNALSPEDKPESPGMKYRHYAPSAPVTMVCGNDESVLRFFSQKVKEGCGILCFDEDLSTFAPEELNLVISLGARLDLDTQAHALFSALRRFDRMDLPHIYARATDVKRLGLALTNRLLRACAFDKIDL